ncbi:MAG: ATP-dependent zinc metalloprotease FtsH [Roseiflexaceae bacterium]|nr:ATP-dependent zinc metalloprotease FtsH [Roseiflexaceae bacterium]
MSDPQAPLGKATNQTTRPPAPRSQGPSGNPPGGTRSPVPGRNGAATPPTIQNPLRSPRFWLVFFGLLAVNWLIIPIIFPDQLNRLTVSYTFFKQQVEAGNVAKITSRGEDIQGQFRTPVRAADDPANALTEPAASPGLPIFGQNNQQDEPLTDFATIKPAYVDAEFEALLEANNVIQSAEPLEQPRNGFVTFLLAFGPTLLLLGLFLWFSRNLARSATGGAFSLGRSRAKRYDQAEANKRVTFDDVAGIDEVERELTEIVDFLKQPDKYQRLGGRIPKGVLLVGPPGTGKTLLARAVAGEANVPFFSMSGSEFVEMVVGVGAARVRDLFKEARASAPAIIFVDELDAIGRRRGGNSFGGNDEREQTLNQLLIEMDGFDERTTVIVLAATNRSDVLDPALLRPGRFDRRVIVQPADKVGRTAILKIHTREVPLGSDVSLEAIAAATPGATGAELANLVNEAALLAASGGRNSVSAEDFSQSLEKIMLGAERSLVLSPAERERTAYHEAGHALCGLLQPEADPVRRVTVVPRAQSLGVTLSVPEMDRYNYSEEYLRARIVVALGGRAAELVVYGNITTGAENDLQQVTNMAQAMVTRFGMAPEVGQIQFVSRDEGNFLDGGMMGGSQRTYSEATAQTIDRAVRKIVDTAYARAIELLNTHRDRLEDLTQALLREDSLDEQAILAAARLPAKQKQTDGMVIVS